MSKLLINEPPLQVLPSLALAIGLNEALVLQQLHYLLLDPNHGRKIAEHRWIFNTVEQWIVGYFPFFSERTMRRTFRNLSKLDLIITCQPEGRISRRKYYRINMERLDEIADEAKMAALNRPERTDGKRSNWPLPITKTTAKTSKQRKVKGAFGKAPCSFSLRYEYPRTEEEMYATLETHGIEPNPDYDGNFFETMQRNGWTIRGERVFDWIETYVARLTVTSPSGD